MRCPYCNSSVESGATTCPHCGRPVVRRRSRQGEAGRRLGQALEPVHIDESVDTVVFSNPVAQRRNRAADWFKPLAAFGMALASVALMGLLAHSSVDRIVHIGDAAGKEQAEQDQAGEGQSSSEVAADTGEQLTVVESGVEAQSPPTFSQVKASSVLEGSNEAEVNRYKAENAIDRSMATAWNEGSPGDGVGEWIEVSSEHLQHVKGVRICGGFSVDETTYYNNARPSAVTISFDDHTSVDLELEDKFATYQEIELEQPKDTTLIRVTIKSVYGGTAYNDCCISEVQAY